MIKRLFKLKVLICAVCCCAGARVCARVRKRERRGGWTSVVELLSKYQIEYWGLCLFYWPHGLHVQAILYGALTDLLGDITLMLGLNHCLVLLVQ